MARRGQRRHRSAHRRHAALRCPSGAGGGHLPAPRPGRTGRVPRGQHLDSPPRSVPVARRDRNRIDGSNRSLSCAHGRSHSYVRAEAIPVGRGRRRPRLRSDPRVRRRSAHLRLRPARPAPQAEGHMTESPPSPPPGLPPISGGGDQRSPAWRDLQEASSKKQFCGAAQTMAISAVASWCDSPALGPPRRMLFGGEAHPPHHREETSNKQFCGTAVSGCPG
jgi:hypothetical protein